MGKNRIFFARWTPAIYWSLVSKPVSQDIQSICYCLHTGTFRLDTCDLLVAGVPISISSKYLYLYLELSGSTFKDVLVNFHFHSHKVSYVTRCRFIPLSLACMLSGMVCLFSIKHFKISFKVSTRDLNDITQKHTF